MINVTFFKDWRVLDQSLVPMDLDTTKIYYMHARAWALKGYLGGTHSWTTFYSNKHKYWLVLELTDPETLAVQNAEIVAQGWPTPDPTMHAPFLTKRPCNAKWFGADPVIVASCEMTASLKDVIALLPQYPFKEFVLTKRNCNTFTSYIINKLGLDMHRPLRSFGFRNKNWWEKHDTKV